MLSSNAVNALHPNPCLRSLVTGFNASITSALPSLYLSFPHPSQLHPDDYSTFVQARP
jgi:hypothetical protein